MNKVDYELYKAGINYYKNIHPDQFYKRNSDTTYKTKTKKEIIDVLNNIYLSFNLAESYFNEVIKEYPLSPYMADAKRKIQLLKKLKKCYENVEIDEGMIVDNSGFVKMMGLKCLNLTPRIVSRG